MIKLATRIILFFLMILLAFLILCVLFKVIIRKKTSKNSVEKHEKLEFFKKKKVDKYTKLIFFITLIIVIIVIIVTCISFYPIEGAFIRFDCPEDSLNYSLVDNFLRDNIILESEGCDFIFSRRSNNSSYHVVSKYGEKFGMLDYKSESKQLGMNIHNGHSVYCNAIYDENSDTSCYFVTYFLPTEGKENYSVLIDEKEVECIYYYQNSISVYALIIDGKFKEDVVVTVDGIELPMMSQKEYVFNEILQ